MTQAKVLTQEEVERVLQYLGKKQHAMRNQCMFLLTHGCGVRIKELVSMRICDVMDRNGQINQEVHLNRTQTKGTPSPRLAGRFFCRQKVCSVKCF